MKVSHFQKGQWRRKTEGEERAMNDETKSESNEPKIIRIDEGRVREHLAGVVREAVDP